MVTAQKHFACDIKTILAQNKLDTDIEFWKEKLAAVNSCDVENALTKPTGIYNFDKLLIFLSPAAENYLERMARLAHQLTIQRFGRTIKLYAPLYLSNYCVNSCLYCGFNEQNKLKRSRLSIDQALAEAGIIAAEGFREILLVSSEDREFISTNYLAKLAQKLRNKFSSIAMEVYPMTTDEYARLFCAGIEAVTLYQETYNRCAYSQYHKQGPKADYDNRLFAPDLMASAGMREIGLGVLLGLADWRTETLSLARHANYLIKHYWQSHISFSFPRLRPACDVDSSHFEHLISDKNLVQMILALRLCFANAGLVLSTRERAKLRDHLINLGITKLSAGSKTSPGGYSHSIEAIEQFQVGDNRTAAQVSKMIQAKGFEPVWKDWDRAFAEKS